MCTFNLVNCNFDCFPYHDKEIRYFTAPIIQINIEHSAYYKSHIS